MTDYKEKYPLYSPWKCRDGSKAVIVQYYDDHMVVYHEYGRVAWGYNFDGTFANADNEHLDLIEPWKDPRTIEGWVNVYENTLGELYFGCLWDSETVADKIPDSEAIKTIKISYTEGE